MNNKIVFVIPSRNTLCEFSLAKEILGWEPKKELVSYIKNYKYENKLNHTKP